MPLALLLRLAGVPWIAAISRDYPGSLLDLRLPSPGDVHEVERGLLLATAAGYPRPGDDDGRLEIVPAAGPSCRADSLDDSLDDAFVVVHPGASVPTRGVPPALACELVQLLRERGRRVVLTASVAERSLASRVASDADLPADALRVTRTLRDLACVLAGAEAVVCGNTGPAHLSAAVGTPVASVFEEPIAMPALLWGIRDSVRRRADPVLLSRARWLASEKLEDIIASMNMVAEGVKSCAGILAMADGVACDMPIASRVNKVLNHGADVKEMVDSLLTRDAEPEFMGIVGDA